MKKICLLQLFLCAALMGQTYEFTGTGSDAAWNDPANWNGGVVPLMNGNTKGSIIIPEGKTAVIAADDVLHWSEGLLYGPGSIVNNGEINLLYDNNMFLTHDLKFTNKGVFNVGDLNTTSILNFIFSHVGTEFINDTAGVINLYRKDIQGYNGSYGILINNGTINKTGNYPVTIGVAQFTNNNHINVEGNELTLKYTTHLNGGIYDVSENAVLCFVDTNYFSGTVQGTVNGTFKLGSGIQGECIVEEGKTLVNQLGGTGITHVSGFIKGPGNFINETVYTVGFDNNTYLSNDLKFTNKGIFNVGDAASSSALNFILSHAETELINDASGVINLYRKDILAYNGTAGIITNRGLINKESNFPIEIEAAVLNNENDGMILVKDGSLYLSGMIHNKEGGRLEGVKFKFRDANHLTNSGIVNPGIGVGQMTVETFFGMDNGILEFQLNGITPVSEYDFIEYTGTENINLNGSIDVLLSFDPQINDSFTVFRANSANITAQLGEFAYGYYEGYEYKFSVVTTNNEIILTMISKKLDVNDKERFQLQIYPNPVTAVLNLKNDRPIDLIEIFNGQGQLMMKKKIGGTSGQLDFSQWPSGPYFLKIHIGNEVIIRKAIKK